MHFTTTLMVAATALASLAAANSVHFVNQDSTRRTVVFTAQEQGEGNGVAIPSITIEGNGTADQEFPEGWIGNWYTVSEGAKDVPGMLGEVRFNGYNDATFFDVSAIVNPNDVNGVKMVYPASSQLPVSGCQTFPCANAYNLPDDIATLSTNEKNLVSLIGNKENKKRGINSRVNRAYLTT
ncbi:uncharacterized protein BP5553_05778 [Venustampulla echinocandica]|uniref:DNase1 protein n=1 Tax=Venustampulla echinocandica TaxID=2656787 RepID=A0A370TLL8_9HELO|nr:uncharacterized protein BP5553_05778 [Venustampulla echinocandica]RDL36426.1 hypothetical protein BP5553_05778 [Venustampulla echinocandica]